MPRNSPFSSAAPPPTDASFPELGVPAAVTATLADRGITTPTPIQAAAVPDALAGRDVLGCGRTGSGKTLAFGLPLLTRLAAGPTRTRSTRPRALVLVPTRELATQVHAALEPLAAVLGLRVATVFGGVSQGRQVRELHIGVDVLVACPGRLEDLVGQGACALDGVGVTVLDEADHMADLGFLPAVRRLLDRTPTGTQRLLFSATLDNGVDVLVRRYLVDPASHSVDPPVAPVSTMTHHVFTVTAADKAAVVRELASGTERSLLFTRTKHAAKKLAKQLSAAGIRAVDLHGNLAQNARERNLAAFRAGAVRVLVATDIAARGIHVDDIALVVHVDPPAEHKAYLHRSGRTARAGAGGDVVTVARPEQQAEVALLARQAGIRPTTTAVGPGSARIRAVTGIPAPLAPPARVTGPGKNPAIPGRAPSRPAVGHSAVQISRGGRPHRGSRRRSGRPGSLLAQR